MKYFVYFLRCKDNSIYIGISNNVEKRYRLHQQGKAAKYTKAHPVEKIEYVFPCRDKREALRLEYFFKTWSKKQKESFLKKPSIELGKLLYRKQKKQEEENKKNI